MNQSRWRRLGSPILSPLCNLGISISNHYRWAKIGLVSWQKFSSSMLSTFFIISSFSTTNYHHQLNLSVSSSFLTFLIGSYNSILEAMYCMKLPAHKNTNMEITQHNTDRKKKEHIYLPTYVASYVHNSYVSHLQNHSFAPHNIEP